MAPGHSVDILLRSPFDRLAQPDHGRPLYDHNFGETAVFWIKVTAAH
jgi:hypothetical protein